MVANKCLFIFPEIKSKKLKSEIVSNLFETQSEIYFNSIGINTKSSASDRDPDLFFLDTNKPCEIKVTGVNDLTPKKCKWMGGKYSKRTSDFVFVMWTQGSLNSIYFNVTKCFVDENEWKSIDSGKNNYYATVFESSEVLNKEHKFLVGNYFDPHFLLCEYIENA
jgi:sucrose-6-phosphate hydrolase SacC (GH32 family)